MDQAKFLIEFIRHTRLEDAGPFHDHTDFPNQTGKNWVITGVTGGIGYEVAKAVAKLNASIYVFGRNGPKLNQTTKQLREETKNSRIFPVLLDYTDLNTIKPAIDRMKRKVTKLDGIIHVAGVMNVPRGSKTTQGTDLTVGVNNVATQLIQDLLDPLIVGTRDGRIVWFSSIMHVSAPQDGFKVSLAEKERHPLRIYSMSKAWSYIQAVQWTKQHPQSTVKSVAVHPGVIKTGLLNDTVWWQRRLVHLISESPEVGALAPLYAALISTVTDNDYIVPFGRSGPVRPDIYSAARGESGARTMQWIENKIKNYR